MDIFSHGLWPTAIYKITGNDKAKDIKPWRVFLWGIFPDLFAFTIPFIWMMYQLALGNSVPFHKPDDLEPMAPDTIWVFKLASVLYNYSHSLFIFFAIFFLCRFIFRKYFWEMGAWFIHILMDIPSHSYKFYPTPFLWPFSDWKVDGISWGTPGFFWTNIILLVLVYVGLFLHRSKTRKAKMI